MKQMTSEMKQQQLDWRRTQVLELASEGYTQREIASRLQVDLAAVNRDIQFLRQQAQENLQHHIHEVVPEEYQKCMFGMKRNLRQTLKIRDSASDPTVKLQAVAIVNDCYKFILDMSTNAGIVSDVLKYVTQKTEQVNTLQKLDDRIENFEGQEEETTTNGVF
jgi:hypothetical protein